jgi:leucyl-tRNA synthetase
MLRTADGRRIDVMETFVKLLSPFAPFISEELWQNLKGENAEGSIFNEPWPEYDENLCKEQRIDFAIQVNGKFRGLVSLPTGASQEEVFDKANTIPAIIRHFEGKTIRKTIFVPGKILNIVLGK